MVKLGKNLTEGITEFSDFIVGSGLNIKTGRNYNLYSINLAPGIGLYV